MVNFSQYYWLPTGPEPLNVTNTPVNDFETFANKHYQIKSYGYGDITQLTNDIITKEEPEYIRMYVVPENSAFSENHLNISFNVVVADKLESDYSNQQDALNDTLEIIKDFYSLLYLSDYEIDWNAQVTPFFEEYETTLCGWTILLTINQKYDYNRCDLPEKPLTDNLTWEEVAELWKQVNQKWKNI